MMDRASRHRGFARRLLALTGLSSLAAVAVAGAGCDGEVLVAGHAGSVGTSGSGSSSSSGSGGTGGTGGSIGIDGGPTTSGAGGQGLGCDAESWQQSMLACIPAQGAGCPAFDAPGIAPLLAAKLGMCDAVTDFFQCCDKTALVGVLCGAEPDGAGDCCYRAWVEPNMSCASGRPFVVEGMARTAKARARGDWSAPARPVVDGLDPVTRAALAASWTREAGYEHASVASFARLVLELLAVGAPSALVRDAQRAMGDEIRHAEQCFALASAYVGAPVGPGAIAMEGALVRTSLAAVAAAAVREGCIGETIAALVAEEARDLAEDPAVRSALGVIAADEAEHAAMAWRLVAWAHCEGSAAVREAIAAAFAEPVALEGEEMPSGVDARVFRGHGRLLPEEVRAVAMGALKEVIGPSAAVLMGGEGGYSQSPIARRS